MRVTLGFSTGYNNGEGGDVHRNRKTRGTVRKRHPHPPTGAPFVMPSKRGMDTRAPEFDTEAFLDMPREEFMHIQREKLQEVLELQAGVK